MPKRPETLYSTITRIWVCMRWLLLPRINGAHGDDNSAQEFEHLFELSHLVDYEKIILLFIFLTFVTVEKTVGKATFGCNFWVALTMTASNTANYSMNEPLESGQKCVRAWCRMGAKLKLETMPVLILFAEVSGFIAHNVQ